MNLLHADELLNQCEQEPIHIPGSIQPFGVLLVIADNGLVIQCSANTEAWVGRPPEYVLQQPFTSLVHGGEPILARLRGQATNQRSEFGDIHLLHTGMTAHALIHRDNNLLILELIAPPRVETEADSLSRRFLSLFQRLLHESTQPRSNEQSVITFGQKLVSQAFPLIGCDRVMIYRFAEDGSGEVIAEARRDDLESFLGLWYPASDIPAQAGELYLSNRLRVLADVQAPPIPLIPRWTPAGRDLDMSQCLLRTFSPVHREYLANMGARGSIVASIIGQGRLWGLLICHQLSPIEMVTPLTYSLLGSMADLLNGQIEIDAAHHHSRSACEARALLSRMPLSLDESSDWTEPLLSESTGLLEALNADGLAVAIGGRIEHRGMVPAKDDVQRLVDWLDNQSESLIITDRLGHDQSAFADLHASASGLLALRISVIEHGWLLWFRREHVMLVTWAGDPSQPAQEFNGAPRLKPRASRTTIDS
jgi:light-regulated signal transduction histidine kinase (bacteriophytochrome)